MGAAFSTTRRAARLFQGHKRAALRILSLTLVIAAVNAVEPLILKYVFDDLGRGGTWRVLVRALVALAVLGLVRESLAALANWLTWRTRLQVHQRLLEATVERLHRLPVGFYQSEGVGAIMTRLDRGIQGVVGAVSDLAFNVFPAVVYLTISVTVMFRLDPRLALLVVCLAPLPPLLAARAAPVQLARERGLLDRWARIYSRFNEVLSGIVVVKSFTREDEEKRRFIGEVADANRIVVSGVRFDATVQAGQNLTVTLARLSALALGGSLVLRGEATIGTLVAFLGYLNGLFGPVQGLSGIYRTLYTASLSLDTIESILRAQQHLGDAPDARELETVKGDVAFENVYFAYSADRAPLLSGVDLRVAAGERVALVGPSGSGKSTLMALLQRFYDPLDGRVTLDGIDLRALKQSSLRKQIGVVLQESLLFDDTVLANIAYGRPEAARADVERAARTAQAHDFIMGLPEGYDTRVGTGGSRLSVGERKRVAIARVLLKDPAVIILDEATAALDAESEERVQEAVARMCEGRTTFVIAHRLSTVVSMDRVVVVKDGRIVEQGRHDELVAAGGYYASLVERQARGLLPTRPLDRRTGVDRRADAADRELGERRRA
jgi:ATP-binding cassette subfamily B protein